MDIDTLKKISFNYLKELKSASIGEKTSLAFINNPLIIESLVKKNELFQVFVMGASVFKSVLIENTGNNFKILKIDEEKMSIFLTKESFLVFLMRHIDKRIDVLALNFAFPIKPVFRKDRLDGILIDESKGYKLEGLRDKIVGEEIEKIYFNKTGKKIIVSVANDTICLLLSALTNYSSDNLACGIVGTGVNFAFFLDKSHVVNTETKSFDNFPKNELSKKLDVDEFFKKDFFELEVSGAYLYKQFNARLKENNINYPFIKASVELNDISTTNTPIVSDIAKEIVTRSAQLVACVVSGITLYKKQDMFFVMEGSVFWKGYEYKKTVEETIKKIMPEYNVDFIRVENSDIIGAAKLVC